ncbi:hypothetical protein F511_37195 [Dorcoceras hygrometricum]|uniref:Uncharacterized protein n=1 Tax=Dorcoceras hygrometricum TaxID=472368 RepID=A0A2Z7AAS0_9LAMI|nr:hypothetical protein F511_37195 [Dorcoceras hygrometricum]
MVYLVTHAMSVFDLQDVCMIIGSLATLDLPMVDDLIGIFELKGSYCMLTMTDWFLLALSVIPRGSWDDVARRFTMIRWLLVGQTSFCTVNSASAQSADKSAVTSTVSSQTQLLLSQQSAISSQQSAVQSAVSCWTINSAAGRSNQLLDGQINCWTVNSALTNENSDFGREFHFEPTIRALFSIQISVISKLCFCTDFAVVIWVYGIFRTLGYLV